MCRLGTIGVLNLTIIFILQLAEKLEISLHFLLQCNELTNPIQSYAPNKVQDIGTDVRLKPRKWWWSNSNDPIPNNWPHCDWYAKFGKKSRSLYEKPTAAQHTLTKQPHVQLKSIWIKFYKCLESSTTYVDIFIQGKTKSLWQGQPIIFQSNWHQIKLGCEKLINDYHVLWINSQTEKYKPAMSKDRYWHEYMLRWDIYVPII